MNEISIRVRFIPPVAEPLTIAHMRIALLTWLSARMHRGRVYLRMEDRDQAKTEKSYEVEALRDLTWFGLTWDGDIAHQSARRHMYEAAIAGFVEKGIACVGEDGKTATLTGAEAQHGMVLRDCDGNPSADLMCVVDDSALGITHVIVGDEDAAAVERQKALYQACELVAPEYVRVAHVARCDVPLSALRDEGFLKESVLNYLGVLTGIVSADDDICSFEQLAARMTLADVSTVPESFMRADLCEMNQRHMKAMTNEAFCTRIKEYFASQGVTTGVIRDDRLNALLIVYKASCRTISELIEVTKYAWEGVSYDVDCVREHFCDATVRDRLTEFLPILNVISFESCEAIQTVVCRHMESKGLSVVALVAPLCIALTGTERCPELFEVMRVLGKDEVCARVTRVIDMWDSFQALIQ